MSSSNPPEPIDEPVDESMDDPFATLRDLFEIVPLHPDLLAHVQDRGLAGPVIHHPLIISVMHSDRLNKSVNLRYARKQADVLEAEQSGNWRRYVFLHERPYRLDALIHLLEFAGVWADAASEDETGDGAGGSEDGTREDGANEDGTSTAEVTSAFWTLVGAIWTDSENIHESYDQWLEIWSYPIGHRQAVMSAQDQAALAGLPERLQVWRGVGHPEAVDGLSWTLDRDKAAWFARRAILTTDPDSIPLVAEGWVRKADVLAYFTGRDEQEIVIPPEAVSDRRLYCIPLDRAQSGMRGWQAWEVPEE